MSRCKDLWRKVSEGQEQKTWNLLLNYLRREDNHTTSQKEKGKRDSENSILTILPSDPIFSSFFLLLLFLLSQWYGQNVVGRSGCGIKLVVKIE